MKKYLPCFIVIAVLCLFSSCHDKQEVSNTPAEEATENIGKSDPSTKEQEEDANNSFILTDGTRTVEPTKVYAGDTFLDWTVAQIHISEFDYDESDISNIAFEGQKSVKGTLTYFKETPMGPVVTFYVDQQSYALFPYPVEDTIELFFNFANMDEVIRMINDEEGIYENCEITIENYYIYFARTGAANYTILSAITSLGDVQ